MPSGEPDIKPGVLQYTPPPGPRWSPIAQMRAFMEERGLYNKSEATFNNDNDPQDQWAKACRCTFAARQPDLESQVWDDIWQAIPFGGNLLWVVSICPNDEHGGIVIPDHIKQNAEEGWVLSVGWGIVERDGNTGRRSPFENPLDLVGRRIFWGRYSGVDLGTGAYGTPRTDRDGNEIPDRNRPLFYNGRSQYSQLRISDVFGLSLKTGGRILPAPAGREQ